MQTIIGRWLVETNRWRKEAPMMPLLLAEVGESNLIRHIGGTPEVKRHLEDLGFVVGANVTIISRMGGNVIVNVKESRLAIDEKMAQKIMV